MASPQFLSADSDRSDKDGSDLLRGRALYVLSNRAPVNIDEQGVIHASAGGFCSPGLQLIEAASGKWIAMAMGEGDLKMAAMAPPGEPAALNVVEHGEVVPVLFLQPSRDLYNAYYDGMANGWLWPLQHRDKSLDPPVRANTPSFLRARYFSRTDEKVVDAYHEVQKLFANAAVEQSHRDPRPPVFMLQDYHLYGVPALIREERPDAIIQQFIHIPWAPPRYWREVLPVHVRQYILWGLLGNDIIGVQTARDRDLMLETFADNGFTVVDGAVKCGHRLVSVKARPIGPDLTRDAQMANEPLVVHEMDLAALDMALASSAGLPPRVSGHANCRIIYAASRVEPSKNILGSIKAFELLLETNPELAGTVVFWQFLTVSRQNNPVYVQHKEEIECEVERVNAKFGTDDWKPIHLDAHTQDALHRLHAGYRSADVLAMISHWDGLNLTVMEGILASLKSHLRRFPAVVASTNMGAHELLQSEVLSVDPENVGAMAEAFAAALSMPEQHRLDRLTEMEARIRRNDSRAWIEAQVADIVKLIDLEGIELDPTGTTQSAMQL